MSHRSDEEPDPAGYPIPGPISDRTIHHFGPDSPGWNPPRAERRATGEMRRGALGYPMGRGAERRVEDVSQENLAGLALNMVGQIEERILFGLSIIEDACDGQIGQANSIMGQAESEQGNAVVAKLFEVKNGMQSARASADSARTLCEEWSNRLRTA